MSLAPLPPAGLEAALRPFGESVMLPRQAYLDQAVLAWERRHLFAGTWTCLGRFDELAAGATHRARTVGDVGVLLTFAEATVRAFANVCRHRGHELLPEGGCSATRAVVCPYHGWSYDLAGHLLAAPRMGPELGKGGLGLVELPAQTWHGWVFVNAGGTAPPLSAYLGGLDRHVAPYRPERLVVRARHTYRVAANWKIIAENYHECYHCPQIHPELCAVTPPNSGENFHEPGAWVGGDMRLREHAQTMSMDGVSHGVMLAGVDPRAVRYVGVFPNVLLSLHPDYVLAHRLEPVSPDRTVVECEWLFDPAVADPSYAVDFWDLTNRQDWRACESVQRGISSPHYRPGPLAPNESAIYDWVTMLARAYRGEPVGATSPGVTAGSTVLATGTGEDP
jgi:Rieske 2Fe-2S family protein